MRFLWVISFVPMLVLIGITIAAPMAEKSDMGPAKPSFEPTITFLDTLDEVRSQQLNVLLYVFDNKTQLWNRAREDTLKTATCEQIRGMVQ